MTLQHQQIVAEMRERYESKLEDLGQNSDGKLKGEHVRPECVCA